MKKAHVRCTIDGELCQDYFDKKSNRFQNSTCTTPGYDKESPDATFEWQLCNTGQGDKIELDDLKIEAQLKSEGVPVDVPKAISKRTCRTIAKVDEKLDRCDNTFFQMKLLVEKGDELCVEERKWYRVKFQAECKYDIKVSIYK
jgi:hypothetical protein